MRFHTKRYDIERVDPEDFNDDVHYEISLNDGYQFSDGSSVDYANDLEELKELISDIEEV